MDLPPDQISEDRMLVEKCLQHDVEALERLRGRFHATLQRILRARGASETESDDTLADLWGECVGNNEDQPGLLEKYSGKCPLQAWLAMVATNRWYDAKRRETRCLRIADLESDVSIRAAAERESTEQAARWPEPAIVELLRACLRASFAACNPHEMVLLRLVFIHGLSQREVARMLGWNESKLSRSLCKAMQQIEVQSLAEVKKRDPWLDLSWQDFLDLCQTTQFGLF